MNSDSEPYRKNCVLTHTQTLEIINESRLDTTDLLEAKGLEMGKLADRVKCFLMVTLKMTHTRIKKYSLSETCTSFYLLQYLLTRRAKFSGWGIRSFFLALFAETIWIVARHFRSKGVMSKSDRPKFNSDCINILTHWSHPLTLVDVYNCQSLNRLLVQNSGISRVMNPYLCFFVCQRYTVHYCRTNCVYESNCSKP